MRLAERYIQEPPQISLEVFPPKDGDSRPVVQTVRQLLPMRPAFVSVTCSAGGTGSDEGTLPIALELSRELGVETMTHVTCANHSREYLETHIRRIGASGVGNIMALRGDPPKGEKKFVAHADGYRYAADLVEHITRINEDKPCTGTPQDTFCVGVAGYPEGHPEAPDRQTDWKYLKEKVDKGADFVVTQMFFDAQDGIDFIHHAREIGITVPIVPGIMPVDRYGQVMRLLDQMGVGIPEEFREKLEESKDDPDAVRDVCHRHTLAICTRLLGAGAPGLHFYTLNKSRATARILNALFPLRPPVG